MQVAYFAPHYIPAIAAQAPIESILSNEGRVAVMEDERRIVVVDYPRHLMAAREVLTQIDLPRPQVRIHAYIYDISLEDLEVLGFNWNHAVKGRTNADGEPQTVFSLDSITQVPFQAGTPGSAMTLMSLSRNFDITSVVQALQTANDARLLADPNVTVLDGAEASWESVTEIPFQQLTQTAEGGQIGTTAFREAGIKLKVVPRISPDGTIAMTVEPEFSRLSGFTDRDAQPIIDRRTAVTTVRVADRQTIVIGGLRQRTDTGAFNGIPALKDAWLFGNLFRARDTGVRESELVVFVMPEIVGYNNLPKPRQMAAAETALSRLNQIPIAEGCPTPGCDVPPGIEEVIPLEQYDGEVRPLPPAGDSQSTGGEPATSSRPLRLATHRTNGVRRLPPVSNASPQVVPAVNETRVMIPASPPPGLRVPYGRRYGGQGTKRLED